MAYPQLGHLAGPARCRVLVTFATRLRVVERPQPIRNHLDLIERVEIGRVSGIVNQPIALVIEAGRRFVDRLRERSERHTAQNENHRESHWDISPERVGRQQRDSHRPDLASAPVLDNLCRGWCRIPRHAVLFA
jgi:hypothetical protein